MNRLFRWLPMAWLLSFLLLSNHAVAAVPTLVTYPAPTGEAASADFAVEANGKPVFVYRADVLHGGPASFASFDFSGTVQVAVTSQRAVRSVKIRPISAGITPTVQNNTIRFELSRPGQLTVELNDAIERPLHLFANPVEADTPRPDDPHVLYFGPGVHEVGTTRVRSNTTVYLAGGAIVRGIIRPDEKPVGESFAKKKTYMPIFLIEDAENVTIRGRGIIDMSRLDWHSKSPVVVQRSSNIRIEGITIKDSPSWAVALFGSKHVTVSNIKQICHRENSDGIDIVNSQEVTVEDCFLRNNDDEVCVKTTSPPPALECAEYQRASLCHLERPGVCPRCHVRNPLRRDQCSIRRLRRDPRPGHCLSGCPRFRLRDGQRPAVREHPLGGREESGGPTLDWKGHVGARFAARPHPGCRLQGR